jgi:hypothetical protein
MNRGFSTCAHRRARSLLLFPLAMMSTAALAQHSPALDRASLWVGGYYTHMDTVIGASDKSGDHYGSVDLENDLGFDSHKTTPRARLDFLIGDHQGFSFDYYDARRTRTKSMTRDFSYGGTNYIASASARGKLNFNFGSAAYRWWLGSGNDVFGIGLGAAYYGVHASISGEARLNDEVVQASSSSRENAWAPMLQLGWRHAFDNTMRMYVDLSGVKRNSSRLGGHIYNASVGFEWFPWQHVGLGAEYGYSRISLHQHRDHFNDGLDMKLSGPSLFARFRF